LLERYHSAQDETALCALVARHAGQLFNLCRVELGDLDLAEDAFQETILALHREGRALRNPQAVLGWLLTAARRICVRMRKRHDRRTAAEARAAVAEPAAADPADAASREEQRRRVALAVGRLPDRYGVPLHLGLQGLSPEQIGDVLKLPVRTVQTRITRGRKLLHAKLQAEGLGAVAGVWLAERRAEAVPAGLIAAAVRAAMAGKKPAVGLAAAAWWLWPGVATLVLAGAVGTGLALWPAAAPPPPPDESVAEVRETEQERDLRLLRDEVTPRVVELLKPWLVLGGEIRVVKQALEGSLLILDMEAVHKIGFMSKIQLHYQTLNGGLTFGRDLFSDGNWRPVDLQQPIQLGERDKPGFTVIGQESTRQIAEAFAIIPVRPPPIVPPGADSDLIRAVRPYLGLWRLRGDRKYPPSVLFIGDKPDRVAFLDVRGDRHELEVDNRLFLGHPQLYKPNEWSLALVGQRLCRVGSNDEWWERDENYGPPP
jgi:RNA polymerase sigma-70 factor (ECF subfamily)